MNQVHSAHSFAEFITQSCSVNYRCCFLGELNLPNVDWTNGVYPQSHKYTSICGAFYYCGFHQTVTSPTRLNNIYLLAIKRLQYIKTIYKYTDKDRGFIRAKALH